MSEWIREYAGLRGENYTILNREGSEEYKIIDARGVKLYFTSKEVPTNEEIISKIQLFYKDSGVYDLNDWRLRG